VGSLVEVVDLLVAEVQAVTEVAGHLVVGAQIEVVGLPAVGVLIEVIDLLLVLVGFLTVGVPVDLLLVVVLAEGVLLFVGVQNVFEVVGLEVVGLPAVGVLIEVIDLLLVLVLVAGFLPFVGVPMVVEVVGFLTVGVLVSPPFAERFLCWGGHRSR